MTRLEKARINGARQNELRLRVRALFDTFVFEGETSARLAILLEYVVVALAIQRDRNETELLVQGILNSWKAKHLTF